MNADVGAKERWTASDFPSLKSEKKAARAFIQSRSTTCGRGLEQRNLAFRDQLVPRQLLVSDQQIRNLGDLTDPLLDDGLLSPAS
jgi:hypothetical protein